MSGKVTVIPATKNKFTSLPTSKVIKRKVAGYARVSTDRDEQFSSYEAQVDYYTNYIKGHDNWAFVKVYTDEGITATNTKRRDGFKEMISDALDGKIDLIVTKSISRFARNTVDTLLNVRKLKENGTEVYFEKENIWTFDSKGEVLLTIMSSLAQEESRSISENVTWGVRKRFADGKVSLAYNSFLGYDKGPDGNLVVNKKEAEVVRYIYRLFLDGRTPAGICSELEKLHIPTPMGKEKWCSSTVWSILKNEKYKGDALLQKTFISDFLTKKTKVNHGEVPQYYVENNHEAIIEPSEWDIVQSEIRRRKKIGRSYSGTSIFSSKLICGDCGCYYGNKTWHSNTKYRKVIWQCNSKFKGESKCRTVSLNEEDIKTLFVQAYNKLMENKHNLISDCEDMIEYLNNTADLDNEIQMLEDELEVVVEMVRSYVDKNATLSIPQEEYSKKYNDLTKRYDRLKYRFDNKVEERQKKLDRAHELDLYINTIKRRKKVLIEWEPSLWVSLLDSAIIQGKNKIIFNFKFGDDIIINL